MVQGKMQVEEKKEACKLSNHGPLGQKESVSECSHLGERLERHSLLFISLCIFS